MLNAPFSDGRGSRTAYQQLPGIPFARHGETRYQTLPVVPYNPQSLDANAWQRFPAASPNGFPAVATQQGWAWPQQAQTFPKPDKLELTKDTDLLKPPADGQDDKNKSGEPLKQAEANKADVENPKGGDKKADAAELKAQSGKLEQKNQQAEGKKDKARHEQPSKNGKAEGHEGKEEGGSKLNASKLIGAFKVTSALLITGGINAFFFGVPLHTASLVSGVVAGSQSWSALKIHKEDSAFAKKIVGFSRKLMGRENDHTPAGKEWSMVPVWGAICGLFGLSEAFLNHLYIMIKQKKDPNYKPSSVQDRYRKLSVEVNELKGTKRFNAGFKRLQLRNMEGGKAFYETLEKKAVTLAGKVGLRQKVGKLGQLALRKAKDFALNSAGGKKIYLGYLWSFGMASFGGAAQTVLAALMQQKVDKAHGVRK